MSDELEPEKAPIDAWLDRRPALKVVVWTILIVATVAVLYAKVSYWT